MRIVTNELHVKRGRQRGTVMFFVSLAILTGGLIFTNFIPATPAALLIVPCIVMPLGIVTTAFSVRLTNEYVRVPRPEESIRDALIGINRRSALYHYFTPKHVLITPDGVYSLTTRFQVTKVKVEGGVWHNARARGPLAPLMLYMKQEGLGNPFEDARKDAAALQTVVDAALPGSGIEVQPLVVFTNTKTLLELVEPDLPVVYASKDKKPSLRGALREDAKDKQKDQQGRLTDEQIQAIEEALQAQLNPAEFDSATEEELE